MRIIIDGYNLYHVAKQWGKIHSKQEFIATITAYKRCRSHEIILVFDGGTSMHVFQEYKNGMLVMYSGYAKTADMVIQDWLKQHKADNETIIISSDHEIRDAASLYGFSSLDSESFYEVLRRRMSEASNMKKQPRKQVDTIKLTKSKNDLVDALLSQTIVREKEGDTTETALIFDNQQHSKEEKVVGELLEKL